MIKRAYILLSSYLLIANVYSSLPEQILNQNYELPREPSTLTNKLGSFHVNHFDKIFVGSQPFIINKNNGFRRLVKNYFKEKNIPLPTFTNKASVITSLLDCYQFTNTDTKKLNNIAYSLLYNDNEDIAFILFKEIISKRGLKLTNEPRLFKKIQRAKKGLEIIKSGQINKQLDNSDTKTIDKLKIKIKHKFYPQYSVNIPFIYSDSIDANYTKGFLFSLKVKMGKDIITTKDIYSEIRKNIRSQKEPDFRDYLRVANCLSHITKEQVGKALGQKTFDYQDLVFINLQRTAKCIYQLIMDSKKATIDNKSFARLNLLRISNNEQEQKLLITKLDKTSKGEPNLAIRLISYYNRNNKKDKATALARHTLDSLLKRNTLDRTHLTTAIKASLALAKNNDDFDLENNLNLLIIKYELGGNYLNANMYLNRKNFQLMDSIVTAYYFIMQKNLNNDEKAKEYAQTILMLTTNKKNNRFRKEAKLVLVEQEPNNHENKPIASTSHNKKRYGNKGYNNKKPNTQQRRSRSLEPR